MDWELPQEHAREAAERWGATDEYQESARRTKNYSKDDWQAMLAEQETINRNFAALMHAGVAVSDPQVMDAIDAHRLFIDRWFYPCSNDMQLTLTHMYVSDPRFTQTYDEVAQGLAAYIHAAAVARSN